MSRRLSRIVLTVLAAGGLGALLRASLRERRAQSVTSASSPPGAVATSLSVPPLLDAGGPLPSPETTLLPLVPGRHDAGRDGGTLSPEIIRGIRRRSATAFDVDHAVVDLILGNEDPSLWRGIRTVTERENYEIVGLRVFGVNPEGLLGHLGIVDGDRLQTVNGIPLAIGTSEPNVISYSRLRTTRHIVLSLRRYGKDITIEYEIL